MSCVAILRFFGTWVYEVTTHRMKDKSEHISQCGNKSGPTQSLLLIFTARAGR